ncbi:MAG: hypothetical protein ACM3KR_00410 [Deltaproteobacteria bacterium]
MLLEGNTLIYKIVGTSIGVRIKLIGEGKLKYQHFGTGEEEKIYEAHISDHFDSRIGEFKKGFMVEKGSIYFLDQFVREE